MHSKRTPSQHAAASVRTCVPTLKHGILCHIGAEATRAAADEWEEQGDSPPAAGVSEERRSACFVSCCNFSTSVYGVLLATARMMARPPRLSTFLRRVPGREETNKSTLSMTQAVAIDTHQQCARHGSDVRTIHDVTSGPVGNDDGSSCAEQGQGQERQVFSATGCTRARSSRTLTCSFNGHVAHTGEIKQPKGLHFHGSGGRVAAVHFLLPMNSNVSQRAKLRT